MTVVIPDNRPVGIFAPVGATGQRLPNARGTSVSQCFLWVNKCQ